MTHNLTLLLVLAALTGVAGYCLIDCGAQAIENAMASP